MAISTPKYYQSLSVYEVFVRNHGSNGTFEDVENDLDRIKDLGIDIIWLMPIHPIGKSTRKGTLGCPYSISDYRRINPEYGSLSDFKRLIENAHTTGLKVIIDVVFNHAAHDSILASEHPEWFFLDGNNKPVSTVADWSDVADLKYPNEDLEQYLINTLLYWVKLGVDGFRCDVASLIPTAFWKKARKAVEGVNKNVIWLAESVDAKWIYERRESGFQMNSDSELYEVFDVTYDYDIWAVWQAAVAGKVPVSQYTDILKFQDSIYPENYIKLRCTENHDRKRICALASTKDQSLAWTAFQIFNKGMSLIYAGQESGETNNPSLFDDDKINWGSYVFSDFIKTLLKLKKHDAQLYGRFKLYNSESGIQAAWIYPENCLYGVFNTEGRKLNMTLNLEDGDYEDLLTNKYIQVKNGRLAMPRNAIIMSCKRVNENTQYKSALFDID